MADFNAAHNEHYAPGPQEPAPLPPPPQIYLFGKVGMIHVGSLRWTTGLNPAIPTSETEIKFGLVNSYGNGQQGVGVFASSGNFIYGTVKKRDNVSIMHHLTLGKQKVKGTYFVEVQKGYFDKEGESFNYEAIVEWWLV